jgi:hypothetical protein
MDRQKTKFISTLLALLMLVSPISSLAMQPAMSDGHSSHCQDLETGSHSCQHEASNQAQCTIDDCGENCSFSAQCSSQAPIILSLFEIQNYPTARGPAIGQMPDTHLSIPLSGLYRPPRI